MIRSSMPFLKQDSCDAEPSYGNTEQLFKATTSEPKIYRAFSLLAQQRLSPLGKRPT